MAKEPLKAGSTTRRTGVRKAMGKERAGWRARLGPPEALWGVLIALAFVVAGGLLAYVAAGQVRLAPGRLATETRVMRTQVKVGDERATQRARESARLQTARVYVLDRAVLSGLLTSIENLPIALAGVDEVEGVEATLREQYALTPEALAALKTRVENGAITEGWRTRVQSLERALRARPLLASDVYQKEFDVSPDVLSLVDQGEEVERVGQSRAINLGGADFASAINEVVGQARFDPAIRPSIVARVASLGKPTYAFDPGRTAEDQERAAALVEPVMTLFPQGTTIFTRGDVLDADDIELAEQELHQYLRERGTLTSTLLRLGRIGVIGAIAAAMAGYIWLFCPRIRRNPARMAALGGLLLGALGASVWGVGTQPGLIAIGAIAPTLFVTTIVAIAYEPRTALAFGVAQAVLTAVVLELPVAWVVVGAVGVGFAVWQLGDVRERDSLIRMGVVTAIAVACATLLVGPADLIAGPAAHPLTLTALKQVGWDSGLAGFGALSVAGVALFILPVIERSFDITTGMTLIELRDPKEPLLRQLQQKAPGTYNHSLNVASLAETAADAIGADSLLTYVGALYHDIGKMNKPDYFVENQPAGFNRHDKLSPAMSLLLIIGHVKDGIEMAREAGLPRRLHHFIEAHHGTTLVEFFFRRAKEQAADQKGEGGGEGPVKTDYRYPGPRPRTKEVAILMICDAVESAARTLSDPTPSRIDQLVREIATKRLMDGQFDECDLTLREIGVIVDRVSAALAAIYHGRIAYPSGKDEKKPKGDGHGTGRTIDAAPAPEAEAGLGAQPAGR